MQASEKFLELQTQLSNLNDEYARLQRLHEEEETKWQQAVTRSDQEVIKIRATLLAEQNIRAELEKAQADAQYELAKRIEELEQLTEAFSGKMYLLIVHNLKELINSNIMLR